MKSKKFRCKICRVSRCSWDDALGLARHMRWTHVFPKGKRERIFKNRILPNRKKVPIGVSLEDGKIPGPIPVQRPDRGEHWRERKAKEKAVVESYGLTKPEISFCPYCGQNLVVISKAIELARSL